MAAPKQTDPQFKLRLTPEVKAKIERAADESGRSMNAEILWRLERSFMTAIERAEADIMEDTRALLRRLENIENEMALAREAAEQQKEDLKTSFYDWLSGFYQKSKSLDPVTRDILSRRRSLPQDKE